ncbi:MAG: hypothetical protein AAF533_25545 [Acidobacteriota bacterium]
MRVKQPEWYLTRPCNCSCRQGRLLLMACPACEAVLCYCVETDSFYLGPRPEGPMRYADIDEARCPQCEQSDLADFVPACSTQIRAAGIRADEYH